MSGGIFSFKCWAMNLGVFVVFWWSAEVIDVLGEWERESENKVVARSWKEVQGGATHLVL